MGLFKGISEDGKTVTLYLFDGEIKKEKPDCEEEDVRIGLALDTETTGLDSQTCKIIEIGCTLFKFNRKDGHIFEVIEKYEAFHDPGEPLTEEIKKITGITDEMLKGQSINWKKVEEMFQTAKIIVAQNASFDRSFLDKILPISTKKIWSCTRNQVDWREEGYKSSSLINTCMHNGFFYIAHRAMSDTMAMLHLMQKEDVNGGRYFKQVLTDASKKYFEVKAVNAGISKKDILKTNNYKWNPSIKVWCKEVSEDKMEEEKTFLREKVYENSKADIIAIALKPFERFINR